MRGQIKYTRGENYHDLSRLLDVPLLLGHSLIINELEDFFPKFAFWLPILLQFDKTYQHLGLPSCKRKIGQARFLSTEFKM